MAIQFVGSKSLEDRRRRRLAVHCDAVSLENSSSEEVTRSGRVESELVESEAAAPWVPVHEWRIWTYGVMVGLLLIAASFSLMRPSSFRPELAPLSNHLLQGSRPVLAAVIQTLFWFLCAQLAILIAWYRVQCKLDFGGRYRVWPWAAGSFGLAAFCSATHAHVLFGEIISQGEWLHWRGAIVAWLLPTCVVVYVTSRVVSRFIDRRIGIVRARPRPANLVSCGPFHRAVVFRRDPVPWFVAARASRGLRLPGSTRLRWASLGNTVSRRWPMVHRVDPPTFSGFFLAKTRFIGCNNRRFRD